jgi:hypothetical protein
LTTIVAVSGNLPLDGVVEETGQRRPSLELLLPVTQAYRVPLDDLVGAPEVGDPASVSNLLERTGAPSSR